MLIIGIPMHSPIFQSNIGIYETVFVVVTLPGYYPTRQSEGSCTRVKRKQAIRQVRPSGDSRQPRVLVYRVCELREGVEKYAGGSPKQVPKL